jgi:beta-lactamase regulating signal transducer with metallopeptidase domain
MSVSGGLTAGLLFLLKPLVKNRLPKQAQYYMWLVVIAALLIPVSKLVAFPFALNPVYCLKAMGRPVVPLTTDDVLGAVYHALGDAFNGGLGTITVTPVANTKTTELFHSQVWFTFGSKAWGFGFAGILLYYFISYTLFTKKLRRGNINARPEETAALSEICGGKRAPLLYRSPLAPTPMLIGLLRPAIILPDRDYTDAQLRAVLLHELTHLRRGDVYVKWLSLFACAVHWFNPVVWFMRREIDRACELSCDEAVIRNLDTDGKQNYGDTLLYAASDRKAPRAVLSTTMCEEKKALKERLGAIMKSRKHTKLAVVLSIVLVFVVSGTVITLGAGQAEIKIDSQLIIQNESSAIIGSISIIHNKTPLTVSNVDNTPLQRGITADFQFDAITGKPVRVEVADTNKNIIAEGEFIKNFSSKEPVYLYIRDGEEGSIYISDTEGFVNIELTLDEVRALAAKGGALASHDLPLLRPSPLSSFSGGYNPTLYGVEGGYRLLISFNDTANPENGIKSTALESVWENGGSGIDIRYNDVDAFIAAHPSSPVITDDESLAIAREATGRDVTIIDVDWWEYADGFPHESINPEKQKLSESLHTIAQPVIPLIDENGNFLAVGKRDGAVYIYDSGSWSAVAGTSLIIGANTDGGTLPSEIQSLVKSLQQKIKPYEHLGVSVDSVTGLMIYDGHPVREIWDSTTGSIITESVGPEGFTGRSVYEPVDLTVIYEDGAPVAFNVSTQEEYDARTEERRESLAEE